MVARQNHCNAMFSPHFIEITDENRTITANKMIRTRCFDSCVRQLTLHGTNSQTE